MSFSCHSSGQQLTYFQGLTYADLDVLFENHVSARKFKSVKVDPFRSDNLVIVPDEDMGAYDIAEKKGY